MAAGFTMDDLARYMQNPKDNVNALAPNVKRRVLGLIGFEETETMDLLKQQDAEIAKLSKKYAELMKPIYEARREIIAGKTTITPENLKDGLDFMVKKAKEEEDSDDEEPAKEQPTIAVDKVADEEVKQGIPGFWLKVLQSCESEDVYHIHDHDEPILEHLMHVDSEQDEGGFRLSFHFSENEYFKNSVLMKSYKMSDDLRDDQTVEEIIGDDIDWHKGKSVLERQEKKRTKKGRNVKTVTQTVKQESFFHYFTQTFRGDEEPEDEEEAEEYEDIKDKDEETGRIILDRLIPRAVECFCGELTDDEDEEDEEDEEEEEDEEDDEKPSKKEEKEQCKEQ